MSPALKLQELVFQLMPIYHSYFIISVSPKCFIIYFIQSRFNIKYLQPSLITLCAYTRGKIIGYVCHLSSVIFRCCTKIVRSQLLGIWATYKHNKSVDTGEKLALVCLESSSKPISVTRSVFWLVIVATPIDFAHCRPCAFCSCTQLAW